jgi:molybdenum cofactor cytidylyltransferase
MKFGAIAVEDAVGKISAHKLVDAAGNKLFGKGRLLTAEDVRLLQQHGIESVIVAALDSTDLSENEAARRIGQAVAGSGVKVVAPGVGRANIMAQTQGVLRVNVPLLERLNNVDMGITIATKRDHSPVQPGELVALVKIVPFAIPAARVMDIEMVVRNQVPVLAVAALRPASVALIISGPTSAREKLLEEFSDPVRQRLAKLNSQLDAVIFTAHTAETIAPIIMQQQQAGRDMVLVASISAIMDVADVVPTALHMAGGSLTHLGVPVDPGSLLMLGYVEMMPVVGAPGCIKSLKTNVIDFVLPRLIAGERLTRADLVAMGHGGLLDDIHDRPMPRQDSGEE